MENERKRLTRSTTMVYNLHHEVRKEAEMNTNTPNTEESNTVIDDPFEQAARNQGFESLAELMEVTSWLEDTKIDPTEINEDRVYTFIPKPEFKEKYEAWLEERRRRVASTTQQ